MESGRVVAERVMPDGELPERAAVAVIAGDSETFEADPATEKMLLDAITDCGRVNAVAITPLLAELQ